MLLNGTWYHNLEDGILVKGSKKPTLTIKSGGSCTIVDYDGMAYDSQKGYWDLVRFVLRVLILFLL